MRSLQNGKITPVCQERPSHTSARNLDRPGWAYGTFGGNKGVFRNEIVAVRLDGSMKVERICHMHLVRTGYATEGHASASPDGARVIWNSNWGDADGDVSVYVAEVRHLPGRGK
jgi:hypothetical protein